MKTIAARLSATAVTTFSAILLLTSGAASASAQDFNIKGDIPFAFSANHADLGPGKYQIRQVTIATNPPVLSLYNPSTKKSVLVSVIDRIANQNGSKPRAEFTCTADHCQLVRVYDGNTGYEVVKPRIRPSEQERLLAVNLESGRR
jgi:hypothetical protein